MATTKTDRSVPLSTNDPRTRRRLYRVIRSLPVGEYSVNFKRQRDTARNGQRGYYWGYLTPEVGQRLGYSREQADRVLCAKFLRESWTVNGAAQTVVLGLSDLSPEQTELFFVRIRLWASNELGLRLRLPEEYQPAVTMD